MSKRADVFEKQFNKRFNRVVQIYSEQETKDGKFVKARARIVSPSGKEYTIEEHFTADQLTDHVVVEFDSKSFKFKDYLTAEVFVADAIGEENG